MSTEYSDLSSKFLCISGLSQGLPSLNKKQLRANHDTYLSIKKKQWELITVCTDAKRDYIKSCANVLPGNITSTGTMPFNITKIYDLKHKG